MPEDDGTDRVAGEDIFDDDLTEEGGDLAEVLCERLDAFLLIFIVSSMLLVFAVASSLLTAPGSANNVIAVLNVAGAGFFAVVSLTAIGICRFGGS